MDKSLLFSFYVGLLLICNIVVNRICYIGPFVLTLADFFFPFTYILSDLIWEVYGHKASRQCSYAAIFCCLILAGIVALGDIIPGTGDMSFIHNTWRVVIASAVALWAGDFINDNLMRKLKGKTSDFFRFCFSTGLGQITDSLLFVCIMFFGVLPLNEMLNMIGVITVLKIALEPLLYPVLKILIKKLRAD